MARGHPDFSDNAPTTVGARLNDMAELAVRLGSYNTFDRLGFVRFMDNMSEGIGKWTPGIGGGATWILDTEKSLTGLGSAAFEVAASNEQGDLNMTLAPVTGVKLGLEMTYLNASTLDFIRLDIRILNGVTQEAFGVEINLDDSEVKVGNFIPTNVVVSGSDFVFQRAEMWHTIKYVINPDTTEFVRLKIDDTAIAVSDQEGTSTVDNSQPKIDLKVFVQGAAVAKPHWHIDNVIFTVDEP